MPHAEEPDPAAENRAFASFQREIVDARLREPRRCRKLPEAIFELLLERFAIDPKRAVYIDDVAANVDAARPFGIHTVHFKTPSALRAELAELGLLPARSTLPSR